MSGPDPASGTTGGLTAKSRESLANVLDGYHIHGYKRTGIHAAVEAIVATHVAAERARVDAEWRTRVEALAADLCPLDPDNRHDCSALIAAHDIPALIAEDPS